MNEEKWYGTRSGWIRFFKENFTKVRHLVAFYSGCPAGHALDRFKDITENETVERYQALWNILQDAWEAAPDDYEMTHCMSGWCELCDLCSEGPVLWQDLNELVGAEVG